MATCRLNPTLERSLPVLGSPRRFGEGQEATRGSGAAEREAGAGRRGDLQDRKTLPPFLLCVSGEWIRGSQRCRAKSDVPVRNKVLNENSLGGHFRVTRVREGSELLLSRLSAFKLISSWGLCHLFWVEQTAPNPVLI